VVFVCEWNPAVAADGNLWLVGIDEDLGMAQGSSTTITGDDFMVGPLYRLLVNQFNGSVWLGLMLHNRLFKSWPCHRFFSRPLAP